MGKLEEGLRLAQPSGCSDAVYRVMSACWEAHPKDRPVVSVNIDFVLIDDADICLACNQDSQRAEPATRQHLFVLQVSIV